MKLSVIVPAYKEAARVRTTAERLVAALSARFAEGEYEIVFVNDGSPDDTEEKLREIEGGAVRCTGYPDNRGKGAAVRFGMLAVTGDLRIFTDCDLAYGTDAVLALYDRLLSDKADVEIASRALHEDGYKDYSFLRRVLSRGYYILLRMITGLKVSDSQSGLKGFTADAARRIFPLCTVDRFAFDLEVLMIARKAGCRICEMPAAVIDNAPTKIKLSDPFRMFCDLFRIRRRVRKLQVEKMPTADSATPSHN